MKGKWAQGIVPRNFAWVAKDRLAVSERLGGYGDSHRRVRRQEEIIWVQQQGFACVVSLLRSPHNLHAYEEAGLPYLHVPFGGPADEQVETLARLYPDMRARISAGEKLLVHHDELNDVVSGVLCGYLVHAGLVPETHKAIAVMEHLVHRQIGPPGRAIVTLAAGLTPADG